MQRTANPSTPVRFRPQPPLTYSKMSETQFNIYFLSKEKKVFMFKKTDFEDVNISI